MMIMAIGELREAIQTIDDNFSLSVQNNQLLLLNAQGDIVEKIDASEGSITPSGTGACSVCSSCKKFRKKEGTLRLCKCGDQKKEHL